MKKNIRISYNAPVTLTFVIICFCVTLLGIITGGFITEKFFSVYRGPLLNPLTYFRMVSHVFGHADMGHFMGNAMYLLLLGPMLEEKYGSKILMKVMLCTAAFTGVIHCLIDGYVMLLGASGIVFMFILLSSFTSFNEGEIPLSFILVAVVFIGQEIIDGVLIDDNISNITHILGGMVGAFYGYMLNKKQYRTYGM